jgi:hypothetical protein
MDAVALMTAARRENPDRKGVIGRLNCSKLCSLVTAPLK